MLECRLSELPSGLMQAKHTRIEALKSISRSLRAVIHCGVDSPIAFCARNWNNHRFGMEMLLVAVLERMIPAAQTTQRECRHLCDRKIMRLNYTQTWMGVLSGGQRVNGLSHCFYEFPFIRRFNYDRGDWGSRRAQPRQQKKSAKTFWLPHGNKELLCGSLKLKSLLRLIPSRWRESSKRARQIAAYWFRFLSIGLLANPAHIDLHI